MKVVERVIFPFQEKDLFSPIRNKFDYARIIVLGARLLLINSIAEDEQPTSKMKLIIDKMSRLFFYEGNRYFSISFPFQAIVEDNEVIELTSHTGKELNNKSISAVIAVLNSEQFKSNPSLIDFYIDANSIESAGVFLLEEILQFEPSYIRFDLDPKNENGKLHPLNHLDVNYSDYGTYKLGLNQTITEYYFENIQNTRTECSYVI